MRPGPAPTRPGPWLPREGEGTAGNAAPGERGAGRAARPAPPPPRPEPIGRASRLSGSAAPMRAAGRGGPRRVCLRNAESHVVLLFLVQSLGARCVTHCAAGTATSPGRRWQHQQQQPRRRRRRRGPRVPGHTPAPRSAARRRDPCGRARLRLGPAARGPPTLGPAREPPGAAREPGRQRPPPPPAPGILWGPGSRRALRHRAVPAPRPPRGGPPRTFPTSWARETRAPAGEQGGGSRPRPLRSPRPLHAGPGGAA